ncbi:MAG: hypothetical protein M3Y13_04075 [Armatimonadota bacterium]|nr:hypothetical protein [Armatimonadota bacterium]
MFKHDTQSDKPCRHMGGLVSALADDALSGLARWYTVHHVAGCPRCSNALTYFQALKTRLHFASAPVRPLTPEHWQAAEAAWAEADREHGPESQL